VLDKIYPALTKLIARVPSDSVEQLAAEHRDHGRRQLHPRHRTPSCRNVWPKTASPRLRFGCRVDFKRFVRRRRASRPRAAPATDQWQHLLAWLSRQKTLDRIRRFDRRWIRPCLNAFG